MSRFLKKQMKAWAPNMKLAYITSNNFHQGSGLSQSERRMYDVITFESRSWTNHLDAYKTKAGDGNGPVPVLEQDEGLSAMASNSPSPAGNGHIRLTYKRMGSQPGLEDSQSTPAGNRHTRLRCKTPGDEQMRGIKRRGSQPGLDALLTVAPQLEDFTPEACPRKVRKISEKDDVRPGGWREDLPRMRSSMRPSLRTAQRKTVKTHQHNCQNTSAFKNVQRFGCTTR